MTKTVKHGIFLVSLFASIGMLLFSHYAYGAEGFEQSFGTEIQYQMTYPYVCQGGLGPYVHNPFPDTNGPELMGSTMSGTSEHVSGEPLGPSIQVLGLYAPAPSTHCYIDLIWYRIPVQTNIFTYFGTTGL
jgi:hypothetical protein